MFGNTVHDVIYCSFGALDNNCVNVHFNSVGFPNSDCPANSGKNRFFGVIAGEDQVHLRLIVNSCDPMAPGGIAAAVYHAVEECDTSSYIKVAEDCNCILPVDSLDLTFTTIPGDSYVFEIISCNASACEVYFKVLEGGAPLSPAYEEPTSITSHATHFSTPDSICQGSRDVPFTVTPSPENSINTHYVLYIDGQPVDEKFTSDTLLTDWDLPEGTYEVCVAGATDCDTSDLLCMEVKVVRQNEVLDTLICDDALPFSFMGQSYSQSGTYTISDSFPDGCEIDHILELTVGETMDTVVDAWICPGESYQIGSMSFTAEGAYPPITLGHPLTGCDSTVHLTLLHITANILFGLQNCTNGIYSLPVQVTTTPDSSQVDITYTWYNSSHNVVGTERVLEVSTPDVYYLIVEVSYQGKSCSFTSTFYEIEVDIPAAPAFDVFPDTVCEGETTIVSINPPGNAAGYDWSLPPGTTQQSGGESNEITVLFSQAGAKEICVAAYNNCGQGDEICDTVTVLPSSGNTHAGPDSSVCGLSIPMSAEGTGFWTQDAGAGTSVFSDSTDPSSMVTVDTPGLYIYTWQTGSGGCDGRDDVQITFLQGPKYDSILYMCSADQSLYTVEFQLGGSNSPFMLLSGPGSLDSNGYFVSDSIASGMDTMIVVTDTAGCTLSIPLSRACDCGIQAGTLDTTTITLCEGDTAFLVYEDSTEIMDSSSVRSYLLLDSNGNVLFSSDTSFFVFDADSLSYGEAYFGQVVLGAADSTGEINLSEPCTQFTEQVSITWYAYPQANAGVDTTVCGSEAVLHTSSTLGLGHWQWQSGPDTPLIYSSQDSSTLVEVNSFGVYTFLRIEDHFGCSDTDTVNITFAPPLRTVSIDYSCDSSEVTYTASVQLEGSSPFTVQSGAGMVDSSGLYISTPLPSGIDTTIVITDSNGCGITLELNKDCDCLSETGMIIDTDLELCEGETAFIPYDQSSEVLDTNDVREFILRDGMGNNIFSNNSGIFPFVPPLQPGTTYEVIVYVGDSLPDGSVNLNANCSRQSEIVNLTWFELPVAEAGSDTIFCSLEGSLNATSSTGAEEWRQISGPGMANIDQPLSADTDVDVNSAGDYQFEWTVQNGPCESRDTVQLTFTEPLEVEHINYTCDQSNYIATVEISGGILPYTVLSGGGMISGNEYTSNPIPSGVLEQIQFEDANGCTYQFDIQKDCDCATSAIIDASSLELTCRDSIISLSGANSEPSDSLNYQWWTTGGNILSSDLTASSIDIDQSGTYILAVEHTENGCADTTQIEITAATAFTEVETTIIHESCAGRQDGEIRLTAIDGEGSYNYQLSTGEENSTGLFSQLGPGNFSFIVTDNNGCTLQGSFSIQQGPSVTVDIGSDRQVTAGDSVLIRLLQPADSIGNINWQSLAEYTCVTPDCREIVVYPATNQQVRASVSVLSGCEGADSLFITITDEDISIFVPNAFTPNSDGVNDHFFISAGEEVSHVKLLLVFDRWGEQVFEGRNLLPGIEGSGWDGSFRGKKAPQGVYTYFAEIQLNNGKTVVVKGDVALMK